jgi:hypothetical protein
MDMGKAAGKTVADATVDRYVLLLGPGGACGGRKAGKCDVDVI